MAEFISVATESLCTAGDAIHDLFGLPPSELDTAAKADETPVTKADFISEQLISERLLAAFPGLPLLREETASDETGLQDIVCLIDPLDGTSSFERGMPSYGIQVGLVRRSGARFDLVASVVHEPQTGRLWQAARTCGTYMCNYDRVRKCLSGRRRVSVSPRSEANDRNGMLIYDAAVKFRDVVPDQSSKAYVLTEVLPLFRRVRMIGSLALQFAYVASGFAEATVADAVGGPYDLCGHLLVDEAGGRSSDLHKRPIDVFNCRVALATNGANHDAFAEILFGCYSHIWGKGGCR